MNKEHGISVGLKRIQDRVLLVVDANGKLTEEDYKSATPLINAAADAIKESDLYMFLDVSDFDGWAELSAAWADFKLGLHSGGEFKKIALVGANKFQELAARVTDWFVAGEVESFESRHQAMDWLLDDAAVTG